MGELNQPAQCRSTDQARLGGFLSQWKQPIGEAGIRLDLRRLQLERQQAELLVKLALEADLDLRASKQRSRLGDRDALRGIPAVGRGVGGAIRGSVPGQNLG